MPHFALEGCTGSVEGSACGSWNGFAAPRFSADQLGAAVAHVNTSTEIFAAIYRDAQGPGLLLDFAGAADQSVIRPDAQGMYDLSGLCWHEEPDT